MCIIMYTSSECEKNKIIKTIKCNRYLLLTNILDIERLEVLLCCPSLTSILWCQLCKESYCNQPKCKANRSISHRLELINCYGCTSLISIPNIMGLKNLFCGGCPSLTSIPNIMGLKVLVCRDCTSLTSIPNIVGLKELDCSGCTSLTSIPNIVGLKKLDCSGCTSLTSIPNIVGLKELDCSGCTSLTFIPNIAGLKRLYCNNCPWLNHPQNPNFQKNISLLKQLQKWLHYNLLSKKIKRYLESERFTGWYYSPNGPGGKRAVKKLNFLASCYQG